MKKILVLVVFFVLLFLTACRPKNEDPVPIIDPNEGYCMVTISSDNEWGPTTIPFGSNFEGYRKAVADALSAGRIGALDAASLMFKRDDERFRELIESANEVQWNHIIKGDSFEIWFNPMTHGTGISTFAKGVYNDLGGLTIRVAYGLYGNISLFPIDSIAWQWPPHRYDALLYYASASDVTLNQPSMNIELNSATNQGLILVNPGTVESLEGVYYASQGFWYFYQTGEYTISYITKDTGEELGDYQDIRPGTVYLYDPPVSGSVKININTDSLFNG